MPIAETLVVTIGTAAAKTILQLWVQDRSIEAAAEAALTDVIKRSVPGFLEQRRARGFLDRVAEEVAQKIEPFFDLEFSGLPDNERDATAFAVGRTLDKGSLSIRTLLEHNVEPLALEAHLRASDPQAAHREMLSRDAEQLYDITLREVSNYIAEIATTLPSFQTEGTLELLRRGDELLTLVRKVLAKVPQTTASLAELGRDTARFEDQYKKETAQSLDRLTLFGLGIAEATQRYNLSVAYITLSARATDDDATRASNASDEVDDEVENVRVHDVVATTARVVIRGIAGSGKTTLLQWLAVTSARQEFSGSLAMLNDTVPFFLPLRRFSGEQLPNPSQFLEHASAALAGLVPHGWVEAQMESGRALLLIDGVDELPSRQLADVEAWLASFCLTYPNARYVVTSRPPAIDRDWLHAQAFKHTELQPMDSADIDSFIEHWYSAARLEVVDEGERADLLGLRDRLLREVRRRSALRGLATSPLLCAVLCTLNRARRAHLPRDRIELYRFALDMLLERRDVERDVADPDQLDLASRQKEALLRDLAYWLVRNRKSDVDLEQAIDIIGRKALQLPGVAADGRRLYKHLLVRSGLIREPVEGRVDFIHRTFQEYLAAAQALELNDVGALLANALSQDWREVIILASGLAREDQRIELLRGLVRQGNEDPDHKHALHLLAVACLETVSTLREDVQVELQSALEDLVPPTSMTEARALSSAGDLAVPYVKRTHGTRATTARACIRTLALIGTEAALDALADYSNDRRKTVTRALFDSWSYFDADEYARRVLASTPFDDGPLVIKDRVRLPALGHLTKVKAFDLRLLGDVDFAQLPDIPVSSIISRRNDILVDLEFVKAMPALEHLSLQTTPNLSALDALAGSSIEVLSMIGASSVTTLAPLTQMPRLRDLRLFWVPGTGGDALVDLSNLDLLWLLHCGLNGHLDLSGLPRLQSLDFSHNPGLETLENLSPSVLSLSLEQSGITALGFLPEASALKDCDLTRTPLTSIAGIERCHELTKLELLGCRNISDLRPLEGCESLEYLDLERSGVSDLSPLLGLTRLAWLDVSGLDVDIMPLIDLPALRTLHVSIRHDSDQLIAFSHARPDVNVAPGFVAAHLRSRLAMRRHGPTGPEEETGDLFDDDDLLFVASD